MKQRTSISAGIIALFLSLSTFQNAFAGHTQNHDIPPCLSAKGASLPIDDDGVIQLEHSTPNQYLTEARVTGVISEVYADHSGHNHFAIQFNGSLNGGIEVVYNISFGKLPVLKPGMVIEACGEYITSNASTAQYPASPMGAIIHWIHKNPKAGKGAHPSGYLVIDGQLYGQGNGR